MDKQDIHILCSIGRCVYNEDGVCVYDTVRFANPSARQCGYERDYEDE